MLVPFAPVVGHGVSEDIPVLVEGALGDGLLAWLAGLQLGPSILVPEGILSIAAHSGESPVLRMKCDVIHGINILKKLIDL